jgi:hypothetical protein
MRLLPLHGGGIAAVDDADFAVVFQHRWTLHQNSPSRTRATRYAVARVNGRRVYLHLFLWALWGREPVPVVEHKDGDGLHCTDVNLRPASVEENNRNRGLIRSNTSGYKGVNWDKGKQQWRAKIQVSGTRLHLGYFADPIEAARAYDQAALQHHGEFAVLNLKGESNDPCRDHLPGGDRAGRAREGHEVVAAVG